MEYITGAMFFILAGMLIWVLYLYEQIAQRDKYLARLRAEFDWIAKNHPHEWAAVQSTLNIKG